METLQNKIDFALVIAVNHANPNGDPLNGNRPRETYEGYGEISDVCLKRKIRNRMMDLGASVFVQSDDRCNDGFRSLKDRADSCPELVAAQKKKDREAYAKAACEKWLDVRSFGQVFAFKDGKDGVSVGVRGPVSIHPAFSVEPVNIESLQIQQFRGIQQLSIPRLNHINLVAGDNNCGKTSLLEALLLLRNPGDFTNTLRIARMRDSLNPFGNTSAYENLLALFPHIESEVKRIEMQARCHGQDVCYALEGKTQTILLDPEEQKMLFRFSTRRENLLPSECQAFQGELEVRTESGQEKKEISFHEYSTISGRGIASSRLLNVVYLAPFDHLRGGMLSSIIKNDSYKDLCVGILQLFDPGITDLLLLKNEITNRPFKAFHTKPAERLYIGSKCRANSSPPL